MSDRQARFSIDRRLRFLQFVILITVALLVMSLFFFQVIKANEYVRLASQNRLRIIRMAPPRGTITDSKGAPLAVNVRTFSVNGYPVDLQKEGNLKLVSSVLMRNGIPIDEEELKKLIEKQYSAPYRAITVASNLTFAQAAELITDRNFSEALFLTPVWKRTYPAGNFTAHVVGYVSEITKDELEAKKESLYRGGDMIGKNGIEAWYDEDLQGLPGEEVVEVDARGRKLRDISYSPPQRGSDTVLTIDLAAQRYAAELIGNFRGAVVAMDVNDGSVKCLYSSPSYDPNPFTWGISNKEWAALNDHKERPMMNRAISGAYPPASTFKIVTASSVLENKVATTSTTVRCPGYFELGDRRFRCWQRSGHGTENVMKALRDSCDVYFYQTATWLGIDRLIRTAAKYGVGEKSGIDLIGEISGTIAGAIRPEAVAGVVFFNDVDYLGMCGHGLIGVVRTLQFLGRITSGTVELDTPAGPVSAHLAEDGEVTIRNVPSFLHRSDVTVTVPGLGVVTGDVAYGGNWFFLTALESPALELANRAVLLQLATAIRDALAAQGITGTDGAMIDHVELFGPPQRSDADSRNFVLCPGAAYDRSPCGTGTSAKMAALVAHGLLEPGTPWRQESIVGSRFVGWIERHGEELVPFIRGRAYVTASSTLRFDTDDPFRLGLA